MSIVLGVATAGTVVREPTERSRDAVVHLLNRAAFGPRPGDVEAVSATGASAWLDRQLFPERLDDRSLDSRLQALPTLLLTPAQLALQAEAGRARALDTSSGPESRNGGEDARSRNLRPPLEELAEQKLLRAVFSTRQLQEVLVDFWFNHFNVAFSKGATRLFVLQYERDAIRPHVLGRFRDLLGATAKSPAMLFYLDNWQNTRPIPEPQGVAVATRARPATRARGINENYARELMELHTMGVDGGYTQRDIVEVARAFTGWTIDAPRRGGGFVFRTAFHDGSARTILGVRLALGGQEQGDRVLDLLSRHPSTARFIASALARRFVSDAPPASLVDRIAETFQRTDGDLRAVMRTLLLSREFWDDDAHGAKVKTPFEFVVSALRGTGAAVSDARAAVRAIRELGMPLYLAEPPTGYRDDEDAWVAAGTLVKRMQVASVLAEQRMPGVVLDPTVTASADPVNLLLPTRASAATRRAVAGLTREVEQLALVLGSPDFQRH